MVLVEKVYRLCEKLPRDEVYGLRSQMKRCAVSIPSNIAEGKSQGTKKGFLRFLYISRGSLTELETQLILAEILFGISTAGEQKLSDEVGRILFAIIRRFNNSLDAR